MQSSTSQMPSVEGPGSTTVSEMRQSLMATLARSPSAREPIDPTQANFATPFVISQPVQGGVHWTHGLYQLLAARQRQLEFAAANSQIPYAFPHLFVGAPFAPTVPRVWNQNSVHTALLPTPSPPLGPIALDGDAVGYTPPYVQGNTSEPTYQSLPQASPRQNIPMPALPSRGIEPGRRGGRKKRARILRDGQLTIIPYGADEVLIWARRVAQFQHTMRMVLGDRRKNFVWSGSVTDSVVGAFLTQNVSDALSSRAYMELASRWPAEGMMLEDRLARAAEPGHMTSSPSGLVEASDTVDWEAVRIAPRAEVEDAIKCRGMQSLLSGNIQSFLNYVKTTNAVRKLEGTWYGAGGGLDEVLTMDGMLATVELAAGETRPTADVDEMDAAVTQLLDALNAPENGAPKLLEQQDGADTSRQRRSRSPVSLEYEEEIGAPGPTPDDSSPGASDGMAVESQRDLMRMYTQRQAVSDGDLLSLEWLREAPDEVARDFLLGVNGLGRKSVACIMLLTLGKKEFPVDVNVGRICARLGWIPLESAEAIEDLDSYAPEPEVHAYLRSRLVGFDVGTLYELHYQMITLGKVFCSKANPNCLACPLKASCEYALNNGPSLHGRKRVKVQQPEPIWPRAEEKIYSEGAELYGQPEAAVAAQMVAPPAPVADGAEVDITHEPRVHWKTKQKRERLEKERLEREARFSSLPLDDLVAVRATQPRTLGLRWPRGQLPASPQEASEALAARAAVELAAQLAAQCGKDAADGVDDEFAAPVLRLVSKPIAETGAAPVPVAEPAVMNVDAEEVVLVSDFAPSCPESAFVFAQVDLEPLTSVDGVCVTPEGSPVKGKGGANSPCRVETSPVQVPTPQAARRPSDSYVQKKSPEASTEGGETPGAPEHKHAHAEAVPAQVVPNGGVDIAWECERLKDVAQEMSEVHTALSTLPTGADIQLLDRRLLELSLQALDINTAAAVDSVGSVASTARRNYHRLARVLHPDKCTHAGADAAFSALGRAMAVITDHLSSIDPENADNDPEMPDGGGESGVGDVIDNSTALGSIIPDGALSHWNANRVVVQAHVLPSHLLVLLSQQLQSYNMVLDGETSVLFLPLSTIPKMRGDLAGWHHPPADHVASEVWGAMDAMLQDIEALEIQSASEGEMDALGGFQPPPEVWQDIDVSDFGNAAEGGGGAARGAVGRVNDEALVEGILLVSCRAALRGRFPLNGTYFQINEVFADNSSVDRPVHVPRSLLKSTESCAVYFGLSIHYMTKGMSQHEVAHMFSQGWVCFRGFCPLTRAPKKLPDFLMPTIPTQSKTKWKNKDQRAAEQAAKAAARAAKFGIVQPSWTDVYAPQREAEEQFMRYIPPFPLEPVPPVASANEGNVPAHHPAALSQAVHQSRLGAPAWPPTPSSLSKKMRPSSATFGTAPGQPRSVSAADAKSGKGTHRRHLYPVIKAAQRCGACGACLNPKWKKACEMRRAEMLSQQPMDAGSTPGHWAPFGSVPTNPSPHLP